MDTPPSQFQKLMALFPENKKEKQERTEFNVSWKDFVPNFDRKKDNELREIQENEFNNKLEFQKVIHEKIDNLDIWSRRISAKDLARKELRVNDFEDQKSIFSIFKDKPEVIELSSPDGEGKSLFIAKSIKRFIVEEKGEGSIYILNTNKQNYMLKGGISQRHRKKIYYKCYHQFNDLIYTLLQIYYSLDLKNSNILESIGQSLSQFSNKTKNQTFGEDIHKTRLEELSRYHKYIKFIVIQNFQTVIDNIEQIHSEESKKKAYYIINQKANFVSSFLKILKRISTNFNIPIFLVGRISKNTYKNKGIPLQLKPLGWSRCNVRFIIEIIRDESSHPDEEKPKVVQNFNFKVLIYDLSSVPLIRPKKLLYTFQVINQYHQLTNLLSLISHY